jgi:8-oxo-dGTP diphosphatase
MPYTPILATLGYIMSADGQKVLLIHRNSRPGDLHLGKYNGREIREEAGIECEEIQLRGTINWPGFGKNGEDWFGFIFKVSRYRGTSYTENPEGSLSWVAVEKILDLPLWEGDRYFLPLVFGDDPRQFHGVMPYENGRPLSWNYSLI